MVSIRVTIFIQPLEEIQWRNSSILVVHYVWMETSE